MVPDPLVSNSSPRSSRLVFADTRYANDEYLVGIIVSTRLNSSLLRTIVSKSLEKFRFENSFEGILSSNEVRSEMEDELQLLAIREDNAN